MRTLFLNYGAGLVFGVGLVLAGMTRPEKVLGFLNLLGGWDPSLAFVMVGAIAVHFLAYRWVARSGKPLWAARFSLPTRTDVDGRLLLGAAMFGAGWGLGGYCPGPAIVSAPGLSPATLTFLASMLAGMGLFTLFERWLASRQAARELVGRPS